MEHWWKQEWIWKLTHSKLSFTPSSTLRYQCFQRSLVPNSSTINYGCHINVNLKLEENVNCIFKNDFSLIFQRFFFSRNAIFFFQTHFGQWKHPWKGIIIYSASPLWLLPYSIKSIPIILLPLLTLPPWVPHSNSNGQLSDLFDILGRF
jgi:hypothetical protein